MIEYLIKRCRNHQKKDLLETVTLSRGYGRRTTGFRIATDSDTAATIGDEPMQLFRKFNRQVRVCVGERRADAIQQILQQYPETQQILLDDAFQHRAVRPDLNVLLTDYNRLFYTDHPFPAGRLRERRHGAKRADAVVVTKCPDALPAHEQARIEARIRQYSRPETPVFFAGLQYGQPMSFARQSPAIDFKTVVLVSGLANADSLEQYVCQAFSMRHHHRFADHYAYSRADLDRILASLQPGEAFLTTEKDWVKLDALLTDTERLTLPLYYLPVEVRFLPGHEPAFGHLIDSILLKNR